jgi:hypothetical protein
MTFNPQSPVIEITIQIIHEYSVEEYTLFEVENNHVLTPITTYYYKFYVQGIHT